MKKNINYNFKENSTSNNSNINTPNPFIIHNLPKYGSQKNAKNIPLLDKIKEKVEKESSNKNFPEITTKTKTPEKSPNSKKSSHNKKSPNDVDKNISTKTNENGEDEEIDDEEEEDEVEEEQTTLLNSINKISSMNIQPNFIKGHFYTGSGFSLTSNNSNNSNNKQRCITEPDEYLYPKTALNDLSGRSDHSGNTHMAPVSSRGMQECNSRMLFGFYCRGIGIKNSFLSTNTNTNSHNQSGQKFDSSMSNESGQSPHYLGAYQKQYNKYSMSNNLNNSMNNGNGNYLMPLNNNCNNMENRHIYTSSFNSNEMIFKQPFSLNTQSFSNKRMNQNNNINNNSFTKSKEKQIINLEDVALGKDDRTTIMIRNIPIKYSDEHIIKELEPFEGKYDCLYMPFDFEKGGNKGYSFLNLTNPYHVLLFYEVFQNKSWQFFDSKKICELNYANFQGINEIKKHAKNYRGSKKPLFFINTDESKNVVEIPMKYFQLMIQKNPTMKYTEKKYTNTFIVNSLN